MADDELKPCPFCGAKAELIRDFMPTAYRKGNQRFLYMIECSNEDDSCPVKPQAGQTNQRKKLIEAWNKRA